jgi:hypothetical protein
MYKTSKSTKQKGAAIMSKLKTFISLLKTPNKMVRALGGNRLLNWMSDETYVKCMFKSVFGYDLDLEHPKTFNEKLQWLKLYNRKPEYTMMVDKYRVRDYIREKIGEEYLIPLLGVWDRVEDIDFDALPDQFVLKCNHDQGSVVICKDKKTFDVDKAKKKLARKLRKDQYWPTREWPYKNVPRKIICEKYMEDSSTAELLDYKFFCFDGLVKCLYVSDSIHHKIQFYDENYNTLDLERYDYTKFEVLPRKPINFDQMKAFAARLSKDIQHVRVDFYEVNGHVYFGEMTFYTCSGFIPFKEAKWDKLLSSWLKLTKG